MIIQHIAAFSEANHGGNPAGVALCDVLPDMAVMQNIAATLGYSETVFAAPVVGGWRVRYFAPEVEVDFCGHATIALGAALACRVGEGSFTLELNHAQILVEGYASGAAWGAAFLSPPTRSTQLSTALLDAVLSLFGLTPAVLDLRVPPAIAYGGGDHLILALKDRETLRQMKYDLEKGKELARREGLITFCLVHVVEPRLFHVRNPFPIGGVYEDPATGAATAALAGYLRDINWPHQGSIVVCQGEEMGMPSRLYAEMDARLGRCIRVSGLARFMDECSDPAKSFK